jgi:hypothetical protein
VIVFAKLTKVIIKMDEDDAIHYLIMVATCIMIVAGLLVSIGSIYILSTIGVSVFVLIPLSVIVFSIWLKLSVTLIRNAYDA